MDEDNLDQQPEADPFAEDENDEGETNPENDAEEKDPDDFGCGRQKPLPHLREIAPEQRLPLRTHGFLDKVRNQVELPDRTLPPLPFPAWTKVPLDQKLPAIPKALKGTIVYARGTLGQKLYQPPKIYTNEDPFNQMRVIPEPYNALHDPHLKTFYMEHPETRDFLVKQGLITSAGQVLCSSKDFNQYRDYLNTLYTDDMRKLLGNLNAQAIGNREMDRTIKYFMAQTEVVNHMQGVIQRQRADKLKRAAKLKIKEKMEEDRTLALALEKEKVARIRQMKSIEDKIMRRNILERKRFQEQVVRDRMIRNLVDKEQHARERIGYEKALMKQAYKQYVLEWMDTKWKGQEEQMERQEELEENYTLALKEKAEKRQKRIERYRDQLPDILIRQKKKRERLWNIVRKYFYRWRDNVRKRKARRPDAMHQSLWDTNVVINELLKYLRSKSGYEKLDDFILSILKLKRDIMKEMTLESLEDAMEEEAGRESGEESEGSATSTKVLKQQSEPSSPLQPQAQPSSSKPKTNQ